MEEIDIKKKERCLKEKKTKECMNFVFYIFSYLTILEKLRLQGNEKTGGC